MWERLSNWDKQAFIYLNNLGVDRYDFFWIWITQPRHWVPLYIIFILLFVLAFHWRRVLLSILFILITFGVTVGLTNLVKYNVHRLRPNNTPALKGLIRVLQEPHNFSFFSGHASTSFAVTTFVVMVLRHKFKWIYIFYIWPILFAMSRIFVGVHYPGDILVGSGVGTSIAFLSYWFYQKAVIKYFEVEHVPINEDEV